MEAVKQWSLLLPCYSPRERIKGDNKRKRESERESVLIKQCDSFIDV